MTLDKRIVEILENSSAKTDINTLVNEKYKDVEGLRSFISEDLAPRVIKELLANEEGINSIASEYITGAFNALDVNLKNESKRILALSWDTDYIIDCLRRR